MAEYDRLARSPILVKNLTPSGVVKVFILLFAFQNFARAVCSPCLAGRGLRLTSALALLYFHHSQRSWTFRAGLEQFAHFCLGFSRAADRSKGREEENER